MVDVGLRIASHRSVDVQTLKLKCSSRSIDLLADGALTAHSDTASLYRQAPNLDCGQPPCLKVTPQTTRPYARDAHRERLATNVHIEVPLVGDPRAQRAPTALGHRTAAAASVQSARVAATLSTWGIVRYFYASLGDVDVRWDSVLSRYLPRVVVEKDPEVFHGVLREMIAEARDAHMGARHPADLKTWKPPLSLRHVGDALLVWGVASGFEDQASPGDELIRIDGRSASEAYEVALRQSSSSTPGWKASVAVGKLIASEPGQIRELVLRRADGSLSRALFPTVPRETRVRERRPETGQRVAPGVSYVDLDTLDGARWRELLPEMAAASAIVFDLRGYMTNTTFSVLTHFLDEPVRSPEWLVPLRASPDDADVSYGKNQWTLYPAADRIRARAVFLVDGRSASAVETVLQIVKANRLGTIVGEQSGGCNGNTNMVPMPGGFLLRFTGMRVVGTDGQIVQGRGVTPDVSVVVTRDGIRSGRDEILEAALTEIARTSVQAR